MIEADRAGFAEQCPQLLPKRGPQAIGLHNALGRGASTQPGEHLVGHDGAHIGLDQRDLELFPGVFGDVALAEQRRDAAKNGVARACQ